MKTSLLILVVLLLALPAFGIIDELHSENDDYDLTSLVTILEHTPDASNAMLCQVNVIFGDGVKDLSGTGGDFELVATVGGQTVQPSPEVAQFGTQARTSIWSVQFTVPANAEVVIRAKSPNAADTDVDVTAALYDVFPVNVAAGRVESDVQLIEGVDATTYIESRTLATADYFIFSTDPVELLDSGGSVGTSAAELVVDIWGFDVSALSDTDLAGGILIWLFNLSEGDEYIDITTTPWQFVKNKKGTPGTEYLRKDMFGVSGEDVASIATVVGRQTEP